MFLADFSSILIPFLTLFCLLFLGVFLRRRGVVTPDGVRQLTGLVLNVTLPPLIFVALATEITPAELRRAPLLVASGVLGPLIGYALAAAVARLPLFPCARRSTIHAAVGMLNTTFVGYAVCQALLGSRGLLYAVLYDAGFTLVMSTLSIWFMSWASRRGAHSLARSLRDLARSPLLWSVVFGVAWGMLGWPMPAWIRTPLSTLGQATMPMALLAVGMLVQPRVAEEGLEASDSEEAHQTGANAWAQLGLVSAARLLIVPALVWGLVKLLRIERTAAAVMVLQTAMPSAVATTAMSEQYGGDSAFAAAGVIATTFLSLLTLPLWGWVVVGG
jgi:predicted permease